MGDPYRSNSFEERLDRVERFMECRKRCSGDDGYELADEAVRQVTFLHGTVRIMHCLLFGLFIVFVTSLGWLVWKVSELDAGLQEYQQHQQHQIMIIERSLESSSEDLSRMEKSIVIHMERYERRE